MKRTAIVLLMAHFGSLAWSFDLTSIIYVQEQTPNARTVVRLSSLEKFIELVQEKEARVIYRVEPETPRAIFALVVDGSVYEASNPGFISLVDFQTAKSMGLHNGAELALARQFGVSDRASLLYVNSEYFASPQEYRSAMQEDFRGSAAEFDTLTLPDSMQQSELTNIAFGQVVWYILVCKANGAPPFQTLRITINNQPQYADDSGRILADFLKNAGVFPQITWTYDDYRQAVAKALDSRPVRDWVRRHFHIYREQSDGTVRLDNTYPRGVDFIQALVALQSTRHGVNIPTPSNIPPGTPGFDPDAVITPRAPTDSLVFELARLSGVSSVAEYKALNAARKAGYHTVEDFRTAVRHGFPSGESFYAASTLGMSEYTEYRIVEAPGIRNARSAKEHASLYKELTARKARFGTRNASELTIAYALIQLPASIPYRLEGILDLLRLKEKSFLDETALNHDLFAFATVAVAGSRINTTSQASQAKSMSTKRVRRHRTGKF